MKLVVALVVAVLACSGRGRGREPPDVTVTGSVIASASTSFRFELPEGWTVNPPVRQGHRMHVDASNDAANHDKTRFEVRIHTVLQPVVVGTTADQSLDRVLKQLEGAEFSDVQRAPLRIGAVEGVAHASMVSGMIPQLMVVAIRDGIAVSFVCNGSHQLCRETIALATWH